MLRKQASAIKFAELTIEKAAKKKQHSKSRRTFDASTAAFRVFIAVSVQMSAIGTFRTGRDVQLESVMRTKSDAGTSRSSVKE